LAEPKKTHDSLFKHVFSSTEHAAAILRTILPQALAKQIDWASMQLCSGSHVDTLLADSHSDLLFSARVSGKPALLYLLFEHQSRPDELMPLRLLKYVLRVLDWHVKEAESRGEPRLPLPLVVPIVLHHSDRGWTAATRLEELFDSALAEDRELGAFVPHLSFVLDDISQLSAEALCGRTKRGWKPRAPSQRRGAPENSLSINHFSLGAGRGWRPACLEGEVLGPG
jgi:hypothetical protein